MGKSKKKPSTRVPSQVEIWKGMRGDPIPPKRVVPMERKPGPDEADFEDDGTEVCTYCGQHRDSSEFEDGLRCKSCAWEDDEVLEEVLYPQEYDLGGEG